MFTAASRRLLLPSTQPSTHSTSAVGSEVLSVESIHAFPFFECPSDLLFFLFFSWPPDYHFRAAPLRQRNCSHSLPFCEPCLFATIESALNHMGEQGAAKRSQRGMRIAFLCVRRGILAFCAMAGIAWLLCLAVVLTSVCAQGESTCIVTVCCDVRVATCTCRQC